VNVSGGVFAVVLNEAGQFGASAFEGGARWLGMQVKCTGDAAPSDLGRQALLAAPYALYAAEANHAATATLANSATQANQANIATTANTVAPSAGNSIVTAVNDAATSAKINSSRLSSDVLLLTPSAPQISVGDANGTAAMLNLRGGSTCCSGPGGYTPGDFKVYQNGSFVATGNLGIGTSPMEGQGYRTSWYTYKGAFRSGYADNEWNDANTGFFSWAGGSNSTASGLYSFSFGDTNFARSTSSIAFGSGNEVKGAAGFSAGSGNRVCDTYGVAFGNRAISGGPILADSNCDPETFNIRGLAAVALGYNVTADQDHSFALGKYASNNGFSGTFVWSDGSATASADTFRNVANNEFAARASGGFRFRTNLTGTTGCNLPAGSGVFNCTSDLNQKEHFSTVDGETVLKNIASMPIEGWNYKDDPVKTRHLGPTAQDFFAAFGLGGSDKTIGLLDIDGINMLAIQALEKRTREVQALKTRVAQLETDKATGQQQFASLEARLTALESTRGGVVPAANLDWLWALGGGLVFVGAAGGAWQLRRRQALRKEPV
jgi:trimeric autotransporter adhesin